MSARKLGYVLIVGGLLISLVSLASPQLIVSSLATVIIDTTPPNVLAGFPSGTSSTPTPLQPGTEYTIYCCASDTVLPLALQFTFGEIDYPTEADFGETVTITVTFTKPVGDSMESKVWLVDEGLVIADSYYHQLFPDIYADFPEIADGVRQISLTMPNRDWHLTLRAIAEDGSTMGEGFYIYLTDTEPKIPTTTGVGAAWVNIDGVRYDLMYETEYTFKTKWIAPATDQSILFEWNVEDLVGNIGSQTSYGRVGEPRGDFYINNQLVTQESTITLATRTLTFNFIATGAIDQITAARVEIVDQITLHLTEQVDGVTWDSSTWTAPSDGTYTVYGYFTAFGDDLQAMSITIGANVDEFPQPFPKEAMVTTGLGVLMVFGGVFLVRKKEEG